MDIKYVPTREATRRLGVTDETLRSWDKQGKINTIRTPGGQRMYDVDSFLADAERSSSGADPQ